MLKIIQSAQYSLALFEVFASFYISASSNHIVVDCNNLMYILNSDRLNGVATKR